MNSAFSKWPVVINIFFQKGHPDIFIGCTGVHRNNTLIAPFFIDFNEDENFENGNKACSLIYFFSFLLYFP